MVKGIVVQFRRGRRTFKPRHFLLDFGAKDKEEAVKLVGKEVVILSVKYGLLSFRFLQYLRNNKQNKIG